MNDTVIEATEINNTYDPIEAHDQEEVTLDTDVTDTPTVTIPNTDETERLKTEISELKEQLIQKEKEQETILRELGEFNRLFPDRSIKDLPKQVWDSVERGIPLSAAYALYEREESLLQSKANEINSRNSFASAGKAGNFDNGEYFSPDEVRAMTQKEVHKNYSKIKNSMKYWR